MAIALVSGAVTITEYAAGSTGSDITVDVGSGSDRLLVIFTYERTGVGQTPKGLTAVSYNGDSFISNIVTSTYDGSRDYRTNLLYLINPDSGSNTLTVTWEAGLGAGGGVITAAFTGVDQTSPLDDTDTQGGSTANGSGSLTPTTANQLVIAGLMSENNGPISAGDGETLLDDIDSTAWCAAAEYDIQTTAETQTMDFTVGSGEWALAAASFKESGGAPPAAAPRLDNLLLLGVS